MTAFAGIDYDTFGVHVVILPEDDEPRYFCRELEGADAFDRARMVRDVMPTRRTWDDWGVVAIGLEEQHSGSPKMRASVQKLKVIQGAILACLPTRTLVQPLSSAAWRQAVGMPGNAKKEDVEFWVRFSSPHAITGFFTGRSWPQDAFDAYCLGLAAEKLTVLA